MHSHTVPTARLLPMASAAVVTFFTIEHLRVFVSGLTFVLGQARDVSAVVIGVVGVAVVALSLLAVMVGNPNRLMCQWMVAAIVLVRIVTQLASDPTVSLVIAGVAIMLAGLAIPSLARVYGGRPLGTGVVLGGAIDIAVMGSTHTLGLPFTSGGGALGVVVVFGVVALASLAGEEQASGAGRLGVPSPPAAAVFVIGPWLAIHMTVSGNLGFIGAVADLPLFGAAATAALGAALALSWVAPGRAGVPPALSAAVAATALALLAGADGGWSAFLVVVVAVSTSGALIGGLDRESTAPPERIPWASSLGLIFGFLGLVAIFLPYAGVEGVTSAGMLPLLALPLLGGGVANLLHRPGDTVRWIAPAVMALALLVVPAVLFAGRPDTETVVVEDPFVLTANLNHGFSADGRFALGAMADLVEQAEPDIVALQEVSRGWVATGGVDMVAWLEWRLGVPVVFGPTVDRQWGVAMGTALESSPPMVVDITSVSGGLTRAALDVPVTLADGISLRVVVTQVHQQLDDPDVRVEQIRNLLNVWGGDQPLIIAGDLGAGFDDPAVAELLAAGLLDLGRWADGSSATWPAEEPTVQHDYILATPDLDPLVVRVVDEAESDHLPLLARVGIRPTADE